MGNAIFLKVRLDSGHVVVAQGRDAWALQALIDAGEKGCTPIENIGPRWSHYVWKLRRHGLIVETVTETHGGPYAGRHARYVLRTRVEVVREIAA